MRFHRWTARTVPAGVVRETWSSQECERQRSMSQLAGIKSISSRPGSETTSAMGTPIRAARHAAGGGRAIGKPKALRPAVGLSGGRHVAQPHVGPRVKADRARREA